MSTTFIDTNGEMSFEDNERLKFIIHYLKKGASKDLIETNKSGKFVREDSELSFSEIWLPAAMHRQTDVDELQKQKSLQELEINQISQANQQWQLKCGELQKRMDAFKDHAAMLRKAAKSHVYTEREQNILLSQADDIDKILGLEQALKGGSSQKKIPDIYGRVDLKPEPCEPQESENED